MGTSMPAAPAVQNEEEAPLVARRDVTPPWTESEPEADGGDLLPEPPSLVARPLGAAKAKSKAKAKPKSAPRNTRAAANAEAKAAAKAEKERLREEAQRAKNAEKMARAEAKAKARAGAKSKASARRKATAGAKRGSTMQDEEAKQRRLMKSQAASFVDDGDVAGDAEATPPGTATVT